MYIDGTLKTLHKLINNCPSSFSSINSIHSVHNDAVFYLRKSFEMNLRGLYWWSWLYVYSISSVAAGVDLFFHSNKYILKSGQIYFKIQTNTFQTLNKYILQFGQIHFAIWTNTNDCMFTQFRRWPPALTYWWTKCIHISAQNLSKTFQSYF